ncbi:hypothetical protein MJ904_25595 [Massilia sp. MB5]|uniref:hypothetical protein n=1 Tax=unclassified Massilia TaxID=2609279 RepID=UPI00067CE205|nr:MULTISPECIES: hypothetical protein [unclassified Massilia]AKU20266.1 hypothetical protein ACZ75_00690 [Massilia sp. NR 4-1]UMR30319.1 hypothetical protein MJ904_25595 [Massilia sp. MB5]
MAAPRFLLRLACLLAAFAPLCAVASGAAEKRTPFQIRCEDTISKTASVMSAQQNGYSVNTQLSYKSLTQMKGDYQPNSYVLGLTRTESLVKVGWTGQLLQDPESGYECIAPKIDVKLSYAPVRIYVGNEFPKGSCGYDVILAHEMQHMRIYMDNLPKVEVVVREALLKRFGDKPLYALSRTAQSALNHEINSGWLPFIKAEMEKVEAQQAKLDSPAEYERLGKSCNGEIQTILNKTRGRH